MSKHDPVATDSGLFGLGEDLADERVNETEAKWAAESEERIDAVDQGKMQTVDGPSAIEDLRSSLKKREIACND